MAGQGLALLGGAAGAGNALKELLATRFKQQLETQQQQELLRRNQAEEDLKRQELAQNERRYKMEYGQAKVAPPVNWQHYADPSGGQYAFNPQDPTQTKTLPGSGPVKPEGDAVYDRFVKEQEYRTAHPAPTPAPSSTQNDNRSDRSYQFNANKIGEIRKPLTDQAERISRLTASLDQNSPAADALVAPELLTAMAGGQGSGLRMNEAEISRIVGGRNAWETLKSQVLRWQADPSKPFVLLPNQRKQVRDLIGAVSGRNAERQRLIDTAEEGLINAPDVTSHRKIVADLRKQLNEADAGPKVGDKKTFPNGKVGVWDGQGWAEQSAPAAPQGFSPQSLRPIGPH